jgi:hypothetical protein
MVGPPTYPAPMQQMERLKLTADVMKSSSQSVETGFKNTLRPLSMELRAGFLPEQTVWPELRPKCCKEQIIKHAFSLSHLITIL